MKGRLGEMHRNYLQKRKREQMRSEWRRYRQKQKRKRGTGRKETREDEIQMAKVEVIKQMELNAQARTRAMVARCHEDGEGAFMCGNVERPRSSGNFKKSNSNGLTSNDEAIYSAACRAQSNDGQIYIGVAS